MSKIKEREGRSSKGQRKEGKPLKVNKARGNDNKLLGIEKAGKQDDASKKFPNFSVLSEEERQVFFEALTTARKNLEKKGVPTRQRFGTVHDEYLNHFDRKVKTEQEGDSEKAAPREPNSVFESKVSPRRNGPTAFVPQGGDPSQKDITNDKLKTIPSFCVQLPLSERAKPEVIEQCESVIRQNTNRIIDLYVKRKKKNEGKFEIPVPEKRGKTEKEKGNQAKENVRKLLVVGKTPKTRNTPRFDALSSEEKEVFFNILDEARNNVLEKNPEKKNEILPLDSIARIYQGSRPTTNVFMASEKIQSQEQGKNINVKVTLTSGDVRRMVKKKSEKKAEEKVEEKKVEEEKSEDKTKGVEDDKRGDECVNQEDTKESTVKEFADSSEAAEEETKNLNVEEVGAPEKELKATQKDGKSKEESEHSQESKTEISESGSEKTASKGREVESAERNGNENSKENETEKSSYDDENSEKVRDSSSQVAKEEVEGAQERAETANSSTLTSPQDSRECQEEFSSSRTKESQEAQGIPPKESVEETTEKGDPQAPQEDGVEKWKRSSVPKVMFVEDNVIDKIRNLIFYLEAKARKDDRLEKEYIKLLVDYVDYLSRVLEALVLKKNHKKAPFQLQNTFIDAEVHLKFNDDPGAKKAPGMTDHPGPRSVSGHNIGGNFLAGLSQENVAEKVTEAEPKIEMTMSQSDTSVTSGNSEEAAFMPPLIGNKKVGLTKIRLLQDLLKKRAEFVEGSTEDLKIVHHPEEEYVPVEKPASMKAITSESEEHAREDNRVKFFKFLTKCFTCGKKEEEYGVFENLKGEAVRVVVSEGKNKDPANATLNQSVMEVLKAAGRKKVIEQFYGKA